MKNSSGNISKKPSDRVDVRASFNWSLSKLMAYMIFIAGVSLSIYLNKPEPFLNSLYFTSILILGKQAQRALISKYQNETDTVYNYHSADGRDSDSEVVSKGSDLS
jgi:hypothetical protein